MGKDQTFDRKRWQDKNNCMLKLMKPLFRGINGIRIAGDSQKKHGTADKSLTYGEINPQSFLLILSSVVSKPEGPASTTTCGTFVDLGCGTGLAVLSAALSAFPFSKCWGIEIVPELVLAARKSETRLQSCLKTCTEEVVPPSVKTTIGKKQGGKDTGKDTAAVGSEGPDDALLTTVLQLIGDGNIPCTVADVFDIELAVAALIKQVGHKQYKKLLKGKYKTFKKFLAAHPCHFSLIDESTFSMVAHFSADKITVYGTRSDKGDEQGQEVLESPLEQRDDEKEVVESSAQMQSMAMQVDPCDVPPTVFTPSTNKQESHADPESEIVSIIQHSPGGQYLLTEGIPELRLDVGDIFEIDWWTEAAVVYCASLLFSQDMMEKLTRKVYMMKPGTVFITLKPLCLRSESDEQPSPASQVQLVSDSFYKMSWHMARVYIYRIMS
mmetsp:Transcript_7737/g.13044  ORF Transcript_7737/g.13044 Transcript_7737/m.13044 type:complete len:439 (-) Transcript_7737:112-1428(-)